MTNSIVPSITEQQLIDLDCCDEYSLRHMHGEVGLLIDSYRALQERLRAAEADARRGRIKLEILNALLGGLIPSDEELNAAIDTAMERQP